MSVFQERIKVNCYIVDIKVGLFVRQETVDNFDKFWMKIVLLEGVYQPWVVG